MSALAVCLLAVLPALLPPGGAGVPVPLETDQWGRVFVRVHLGPAGPFRFLLDTGSTLSAISAKVASRLSLPDAGRVPTSSLGRRSSARLVRTGPVGIGGRAIPLRWMIVLDQKGLDPSSVFDGVVGQDLLGQLDYLLRPGSGTMWLDPPEALVLGVNGVRLPLRGAFGPLTVVDRRARAEWSIDSGASHPVLFREGVATPTGTAFTVVTSAGRHSVERLHQASIDIGGMWLSWNEAVLQRGSDRREHGLLPLALFDAVYVNNHELYAQLASGRSR